MLALVLKAAQRFVRPPPHIIEAYKSHTNKFLKKVLHVRFQDKDTNRYYTRPKRKKSDGSGSKVGRGILQITIRGTVPIQMTRLNLRFGNPHSAKYPRVVRFTVHI